MKWCLVLIDTKIDGMAFLIFRVIPRNAPVKIRRSFLRLLTGFTTGGNKTGINNYKKAP
ncbi:hypothetical protein ACNFU2_08120 [Chryseobacterium sp. PTM-20240506]|uniref:hypothetical protein n=1 Tax=unclassified Chryseobacterium TaxID=2593645 RepID=UPI0027966CA2|nr:hypothetical protein [Chryseobacterium sp. CKR4-1]MDQ1805114.1 hypothetical protein [Chryseobacterium sp. CKR4-1]